MSGVRPPQQDRGRASLDRLLDAAEAILAERGLEGLSISALSARSGISNGGIYWRVDSLEALTGAVHQRLMDRMAHEHDAYDDPDRWIGLDVAAFVSQSVRIEAEVARRHAGSLRAIVRSTTTDQVVSAQGDLTVKQTERRFVAHVSACLAEHGCPQPDAVATVVFRIAFGALINRVTWPEQQSDPEVPWPDFIDGMCAMTSAWAAAQTHPSGQGAGR